MKRAAIAALTMCAVAGAAAQDRLPTLPGYEQHQRMAPLIANSWVSGAIVPHWNSDSTSFTSVQGGRQYRFDVNSGTATDAAGSSSSRPESTAPARFAPQNGAQS